MATYSVLTAAGGPITPTTFFQPGATFRDGSPTSYNLDNPSGTIVAITGSGFAFDGSNVPTAGTVTAITLYQGDFATQLVGIGGLSMSLITLHDRWLGPTPGSVFGLLLGGNDIVTGSTADDTLHGFGSNDVLDGFEGNDYLDPGRGTDTVDGGAGLDTISYSAANNDAAITQGVVFDLTKGTITDPWGDTDTILSIERARGTRFADGFIGTDGDNRFDGLDGADTYAGGGGHDRIGFSRDAQFGGGLGVIVDLGAGTATDGFGNAETFTSIEEVVGTAAADTLTGGDTALPGGAAYNIFALGGDDIIAAGAHDLYAEPGAGNDTITAGPGFDQVSYADYTGDKGANFDLSKGTIADPYGNVDTLVGDVEGARGTPNADTFIGNALNNRFAGLAGNDTLIGGEGVDRARYDRDAQYGGSLGITVDLGAGTAVDGFGDTDTLVSIEAVQGTEQGDTITSGSAALGPGQSYELYGRGGSDTLVGGAQPTYYEPGTGDDTITGGSSLFDLLSYSDFTGPLGVTIDLALGTLADPSGGTDTFTGIEGLRGTNSVDTLTGDGGANQFAGLDGADTIDGGAGVDLVRYDRDERFGGTAGVLVDLKAGTGRDGFGAVDTLKNIESVRGSNALTGNSISLDGGTTFTAFADALYGDDGDNLFQGLRGDDLIDGRGGSDTADYSRDVTEGGGGGVTVNLAAGAATDGFGSSDRLFSIENVIGSAAGDTIGGDDGANVLDGGGGEDTLTGGLGNDTMIGGGGADTAVFSAARAAAELRYDPVSATLTVLGPDGIDTLSGVETLQFADRTIAAIGPGGVQHLVNVTFPASPTNPVEASRFMIGSPYAGPVAGLTDEFVFPTLENINIASTLPNAFIRTGAGNDAITVFSGRNVIDAFTGSNFLTGGSGHDTFFLDARGGGSTWDTIVNFGVGDEVTLWGYVEGVSTDGLDKSTWYESDGAEGFRGLTIHAKLDGVNFGASVTFAGLGLGDRESLQVSVGSVAGNDYLYVTRVL
jgi:Ca2+-binding RTX toxin-like protein